MYFTFTIPLSSSCVCRFQKLSARWFREYPWPEAEKISDIVEQDELFLHLYRELYCRHIYAMHKVGAHPPSNKCKIELVVGG